MVGQQALNAYRRTEKQAEIHPVKLIHMLYERVLVHLDMAEKGIREKNAKLRGENLSKAIAIITELNASIKTEDNSEAAQFLRGLYSAILVELPKVSVSDDVQIVRQAAKYLNQLKQIWEQTAMQEIEQAEAKIKTPSAEVMSLGRKRESFDSVPEAAVSGLSVSI